MHAGLRQDKGLRRDALRVRCEPVPHDEREPPFWLRNLQWAAAQKCRLFPDATLTVGGEEFKVHRTILSAQSMYFERLFNSCMLEGVSYPIFHVLETSLSRSVCTRRIQGSKGVSCMPRKAHLHAPLSCTYCSHPFAYSHISLISNHIDCTSLY